jgi:hypothetical protein
MWIGVIGVVSDGAARDDVVLGFCRFEEVVEEEGDDDVGAGECFFTS